MTTQIASGGAISARHDFVLLFDCLDGNPNGDPDGGNLPRFDPETLQGLVTDVCLKRKLRDTVAVLRGDSEPGYRIYVQHQSRGGSFLNALHREAQDETGMDRSLPDKAKERSSPKPEQIQSARSYMCQQFWDVRSFGAVMSTGVNAGQVRGPVQITFARSVDPIVPTEFAITRVAKTTVERSEKAGTTEIGRKFTVPYGLYRAHGFISASFARDTGFTQVDLDLLWEAISKMFWDDHSAARGQMAVRGLYVFRHSSALGNAPAHVLFDRITIKRRSEVVAARSFADYDIAVGDTDLPAGVELLQPLL